MLRLADWKLKRMSEMQKTIMKEPNIPAIANT